MFLGREKQLEKFTEEFNSQKRTAILVYGKRRVGKSTLIAEATKTFNGTVINHLCSESSYEGNLSLLSRSISNSLSLPEMQFKTIFDVFDFLKAQKKKILLVLDEYQYLKNSLKENEMDSYMQIVIESLPPNLKLVLCGSYISIMKELLKEENPLFGRFSSIIALEEFDYYDAARFFPNLPVQKKIEFYSVFGGSPYVLSNLDYSKSVEQNIKKLLIDSNSLLHSHISNVMLREIQKSYDVRIFQVLGNGKKQYSELCNFLGKENNGLLDKQLKNLIQMDAITKVFPINKANDRKKVFYEIKDNLMRFYFTFIFANSALISKFGDDAFYDNYIKPSLDTFISLRFEGIVNQYFNRLAHAGKLKGVLDFGSYWYDDKKSKTNGQFDCILQTTSGYDFYEAKFYKKPMKLSECEAEESQIRAIPNLPCDKIGFVCSQGFAFESKKYKLITGEDLFDIPKSR